MRLLLRLVTGDTGDTGVTRDISGVVDDVIVDVDQDATIGDLARALFPAPPGGNGDAPSLLVDELGGGVRHLSPLTPVDGSGLRSGATVRPTASAVAASCVPVVGELSVVDGPDAPRRVPLRNGWNTIGRAPTCDVVLQDPLVSRRHARIRVGEITEIVDDGAANGVVIGGRVVERAILDRRARVTLGASTLAVERLDVPAAPTVVAFNRSPRVDPHVEGARLTAPRPPQPPAPHRFPVATVLAPVVLAAVLFAFTQSLLSVLFFALSPILMIGSWWETRSADRRQVVADTARFRAALGELAEQLEYAQSLERRGRRHELPGVVEVIEAVDRRSALLWTRRPEHASFGVLRAGLGVSPSRTTVELPGRADALPGLWAELDDTVARFVEIDGVPLPLDLAAAGNVGICGPPTVAVPVFRGVVAQLAGLHAPGDVRIVAIAPDAAWDWVKWLPHTAAMAGNGAEAVAVVSDVEAVVGRRLADVEGDRGVPVPRIVVLIGDGAPVERARLVEIAERGPVVGVHTIWLAPTLDRLPAACRSYVDVDGIRGTATVGLVHEGRTVDEVDVEPVGAAVADRLARRLSPVTDAGAPTDVVAELPSTVPIGDVFGDPVAADPGAVAERWRSAAAGLRAVVGRTVDGPLALDLRTQGPHALVGGTTGSGKSEFLQSWILALALDHGPDRVNFLLVDYKGGAAFAGCVDLPHVVGLVTDLRPRLVRRALASLGAELRRREQLLHDRGAKDLAELERTGCPDAPPSLVIVVDEFAALVAEVPEFVDGVVDIAQRGRSLGLHLVLATQRPAGVINDNVRANTDLRIALRMADPADSTDVIGSSCAAHFDQDVPGRAVVRTGVGRAVTFQAVYSGGWSAGRTRRPPIRVASLRFGRPVERDVAPDTAAPAGTPTDIERIVAVVRAAACLADLVEPRRPWLPELAAAYRLELLPASRTDDRIVIGVVDDPDAQAQPVLTFRPDLDGNLAVYGTGGSGKSTLLRTIAVAAAAGATSGHPVRVYGIDVGGHGLRPLAALPHVAGIVAGDDDERVQRLLRLVETELDDRAARYVAADASTIGEFRTRTGEDADRILLLVDGVGGFRNEYEGGLRHAVWERFVRIAAEGRSVGIHVVVAADRPAALPSSLASVIQREVVLRTANEIDQAPSRLPAGVDLAAFPPGRGLVDGREVQIAVPGGERSLAVQSAAIEACAAALRRSGAPDAPPIGSLPSRVAMSDIARVDGRPAFGLRADDLAPIGVPTAAGGFLVAGDARSGVSTTTASVLRVLAAASPEREFVLLGSRRSPLTSSVPWTATASGPAEIAALTRRLGDRLTESAASRLVVVVEAVGDLVDSVADPPLQGLLRTCRELGAFVVADGSTSGLGGSWPLLQAVKAYRCGIVLQPDQMDGEALFKVPFPRCTHAEYPVGRGLLVADGHARRIHVAVPE